VYHFVKVENYSSIKYFFVVQDHADYHEKSIIMLQNIIKVKT